MNKTVIRTVLLVVVLVLGACATPAVRTGTEVTRFHRDDGFAPQLVNLEPADEADYDSLEYQAYEEVIAAELLRLGFEPVKGDEAALIGVVDVEQTLEMQAPERSPFSIGIGGGSFGSGGGVGASTSTEVGGTEGGEVTTTQLEVRLVDRADNAVVWEGRAVRTAEPGGDNRPVATVQRLATALFQDFPGESGSTTTIP
ncbi:MAG: DUF4136 domain-containing protein [Gammaproteobacteria bacterium]